MHDAAVAALCGMDPLAYIHADGLEKAFFEAVLAEAAHQRSQELQQVALAIGKHAGYHVGEALAQMFRA